MQTGAFIAIILVIKPGNVCNPANSLHGRPPLVMAVGQNQTCLLYGWDRHSGRHFLVDIGEEVSIFPTSNKNRHSKSQGIKLTAANGSDICTYIYGKRTIPLHFNNRHFKWIFTITHVSQPLLSPGTFAPCGYQRSAPYQLF